MKEAARFPVDKIVDNCGDKAQASVFQRNYWNHDSQKTACQNKNQA
ncbi:hypothetical protein [Aquidulcibacter paucihalophilus]|nr:hypothetical protein [Aquidulcibacter paucihalophilus]